MKKLLTKVYFVGAEARVEWSPGLEAALTYTDKYEKEVKLFWKPENALWAWIPRGLVDVPEGKDGRVSNPLPAIKCAVGPRKADNARCLKESVLLLKSGQDHITEAPTGWGKTYHGCAVSCALGETTLIIVTKNDLIEGWHSTMLKLVGVSPEEIGHVQQKKCSYKGKRFVIAMAHSLVEREYDEEFYKYFGLVIFDEVHRLGADYFEKVCKLFPARHRLGLSATPDRKDGRYRTFHAHIGPVLVRGVDIPMVPKILVKQTGWEVPKYPKFDPEQGKMVMTPLAMQPGQLGLVVKRMGSDFVRNQQIAEFVKASYDAGRSTLVLSDLIDGHLKKLFHVIAAQGVPGNHIDYYIGGRKQADLNVAKHAPVVLATFAFTSEGTNVPHWDTLVLATPKADVQQSIGRILRDVEGKKQPVVLDLVDNHKLFGGYYNSRMKNYFKLGAEIVKV